MPKRIDHDQRRREIATAVWRLSSRTGLENVTLRQVAAEAGVSMRLVQYYFGTRHQLLISSLAILNEQSTDAAAQRLAASADQSPRAVLRAVLAELLPLDDARRTRYLVHAAYFVRSLSDPELAAVFREAPSDLEQLVASLLAAALGDEAADHLLDAEALIALCDGLATKLILEQRSSDEVLAVLDHHLDRLSRG